MNVGTEIQRLVSDYKSNPPNSIEMFGRKFLHFITFGYVDINPKLNNTIAVVVALLKTGDKLIPSHLAAVTQLSELANTQDATEFRRVSLQNAVKIYNASHTAHSKKPQVLAARRIHDTGLPSFPLYKPASNERKGSG